MAFRELGDAVTAFEASPALARMASEHCGQPVEELCFQQVEWQDACDGIRACASLLDAPMAELSEVSRRFGRAFKADGMLYASFQYGAGEREQVDRRFMDLDEAGLADLRLMVPGLLVLQIWVTGGSALGAGGRALAECDGREGIADTRGAMYERTPS